MKIRLLPETDLARIAPMPIRQKERALRKMKDGRPPYSYLPYRKTIFDTLNVELGFLPHSERSSWNMVAQCVARESKTTEECLANLRVADALYKFATQNKISGRRQDFFPLVVGFSQKLAFWHPAVLSHHGVPLILFSDPRSSSSKLTSDGRKFVFSVMHERIRAADADFVSVDLGILQFDKASDGTRSAVLHAVNNDDLFAFDDLDVMIRETYDLWISIQRERIEEIRRKGTGTTGPLV